MLYLHLFHWMRRCDGAYVGTAGKCQGKGRRPVAGAGLKQQGSCGGCCRGAAEARELGLGLGLGLRLGLGLGLGISPVHVRCCIELHEGACIPISDINLQTRARSSLVGCRARVEGQG